MFYDFSNPMELPLKLYTDEYYYNLEAEAAEFNEKGECVLTVINDDEKRVQMTVDILSPGEA
jgi:hypothetical protein